MNLQIDDLEERLAGLAASAPTQLPPEAVERRIAQRRRRRLTSLALAAACIVALVAGVLVVERRSPASISPGESSTTIAPDLPLRGPDFLSGGDPPLLTMPSGEWTVSYFDDQHFNAPAVIVVPADTGFAGGSFALLEGAYGGDRDLAPSGLTGTMSTSVDDSWRTLTWTVDGVTLSAGARHLTESDAIAIAKSVRIGTDRRPVVHIAPAGFVALTDAERVNASRFVEYQFVASDGRDITVTLTPGADIGVRIGGESATQSVSVGGHKAILSYDGTRLDWVDGFWVVEIQGQGYTGTDQFLADAAKLTITDEATWSTSMPDSVVKPADRAAVIDQVLVGIPLPAGFDRAALAESIPAGDHYQFATHVVAAAMCPWFDQYFTAVEHGDGAGAQAARTALLSSHDWPILKELDDQGGWPGVVWEYVDATAGGSIPTGGGPAPLTREAVVGGLGCPA